MRNLKNIDLRKAETQDVLEVHNIQKLTMPEAYSIGNWHKSLALYEESFFVIEMTKTKKLLGYIVGQKGQKHPIHDVYEGLINSLAIKPSFQRFGFGEMLLNRLKEYYKSKHITKFVLFVRDYNTSAITFYKKHGFEIERSQVGYYENGDTAYIMRNWLKEKKRLEKWNVK